MVRMLISRIYMDIHACFLMRACTVFFFPPSPMLVGGKRWKAQGEEKTTLLFGTSYALSAQCFEMGSKLYIWGFLSVKKTSSSSSTQCLPWQHNTAAAVNQSMSFEALGKVCGKSKRKEYVIHVNSSTMNTWMSRSWSLPRELPWSIAKSAIFLFFQHLLNVAGSNSCCQEFLHKWRLQVFAPGCFCWNFAQVRRMDQCHGSRLCASLLRQIDNSFYTCCLLRFSQISQTKELLPSTYPSELLACLLSSFLPSYISITFSSCFHDTTTFVQVWSSWVVVNRRIRGASLQ